MAAWGQTNLITNSDLQTATCGDSPGVNCDHFHDCVTGWTITHGTPNYFATDCSPYPEDDHIQLICQTVKSEGVMTPVSLEPGCHQLFIKVRVASIGDATTPTLRVSLDHDLEPWDELVCQQIIPSTSNTTFIFNEEISINNNAWQWIIIDFDVDPAETFLDQLMITGLSDNEQINLHIDCIYLYRHCQEALGFTSPVNGESTIVDGVYNSCSYILIHPASGGTVNVPMDANVILNAVDEIRILHNFRAQHNFHASLGSACSNPDENFRPDCYNCPGSDGGDGGIGKGNDGGSLDGRNEDRGNNIKNAKISAPALEQPIVYPNPTQGIFEITTTAADQEVSIYNLMGTLVFREQTKGQLSVDASAWNKGLYVIEFVGKDRKIRSVTKLVIQ